MSEHEINTVEQSADTVSEGGATNITPADFLNPVVMEPALFLLTAEGIPESKEGPSDLAEIINAETEAGARLFVQNTRTNEMKAQTSKFYLTSVQMSYSEKTQLLETFGASVVSFFGEKARVYNFAGTALDYASSDPNNRGKYFHQSSLIKLYNSQLRGSLLVERGDIAILKIANHTISGYPLNFQVQYSAQMDKMANFAMSWLVTEHTLDLAGVVSEDDLDTMNVYGQTFSEQTQKQLFNTNAIIEPLTSLLNFEEYDDPLYNPIKFLSWGSITRSDLRNYFNSDADRGKLKNNLSSKMTIVGEALKAQTTSFSEIINKYFLSMGNEGVTVENEIDTWSTEVKSTIDSLWGDGDIDVQDFNLLKIELSKLQQMLNTFLR